MSYPKTEAVSTFKLFSGTLTETPPTILVLLRKISLTYL